MGTKCIVRTVSDRDPGLLRHLAAIGVAPGTRLVVREIVPFGGGVRVRIKGEEHVVGTGAALEVRVELSS